MAFAEDLIEQAYHLARREKRKPKQASLRRAISTAYYALFHLLISEAVANWKNSSQRHALARAFEHGKMKSASNRTLGSAFSGHAVKTVEDLRTVAAAFVQLQEYRQTADYNNSRAWTRTDAISQIDLANTALLCWKRVRSEEIAQDYLLSFLVNRP